ncbi:MAG: hypothetical protein JNK07_19540 [Alphaproteobacteria bacterium]|nr:hypothetical protein [Alphaproteobacteria bacterium]
MFHEFRFATPVHKDSAAYAAWLCEGLRDRLADADVAEPLAEAAGHVIWLDIGGTRFELTVARSTSAQDAWLMGLAQDLPAFVPRVASYARDQERFDALVAAVRALALSDPTTRLIDERDD